MSDINYLEKTFANIAEKKTIGNRKVLNIHLKDLGLPHNIRFRESRAKGGKSPDAKTTEKQEKGSKFVFEYVLANKKSGYANLQAFKSDQKMIDGLKKITTFQTRE